MPLGIISKEQLDAELSNNGPTSKVDYKKIEKGRGEGQGNVPEEIRKIISEEAIKGAPLEQLAELFNVSKSSVQAYKKGATSTATYNEPNQSLAIHNDLVKEKIRTKAQKRISLALTNITPRKLEDGSLKELSSVARDLSIVMKNMEPDKESNVNNGVQAQFIFHVPKMKEEKEYDVITVEN